MATDRASEDQVANELSRLLAAEGVAICTMPRMFGVLMRQSCPPGCEDLIVALEAVQAAGIVAAMREPDGRNHVPALADRLTEGSQIPEERIRWAIETWWRTIEGSPDGQSKGWAEWNKLDVSQEVGDDAGIYQRSVIHLVIVGLAGALGGSAWGFLALIRGEGVLIEPAVKALEDLDGWLRVFALFALGGLGGLAGGILGWVGGGGRSWTYDAHGGTTVGRLGLSCNGAFFGALAGGMAGLAGIGLAGMMFTALAGAAVGSFLGLLTAERLSLWRR